MMREDFTLEKYKELCQAISKNGYCIMTVASYISGSYNRDMRFVVLRHDVDRRAVNALHMAKIESKLQIASSYYFRYPETFDPKIIRDIASLGHEIGYHYDSLAKAKGDETYARCLFERGLGKISDISDVKTVSMHGSPLSKYNNLDIWKTLSFDELELSGDASMSISSGIHYFTDTGRSWNRKNNLRDHIEMAIETDTVKTTDDLLTIITTKKIPRLYISAHPERWASNRHEWYKSYFKDQLFNIAKSFFWQMR